MAQPKIYLLGNFQLIYKDESVEAINQARQHALLAYLLLNRHAPQPRRRLSFIFWPNSTEKQALTNLRKALHKLRQVLPDAEQLLHISAKTVQWQPNAPFTLDIADFEKSLSDADKAQQLGHRTEARAAFEAAIDLYRGQLLPNCYDDWILPHRERLDQLFIHALEQLLLLLEEQRNYSAAIRFAQRLLRHNPLHEATYRCLMRLHTLNGDRAGALHIYHTCATVLQRELGVDPNPMTQEAHARLLKRANSPLEHSTAPAIRVIAPPLVGRRGAWQELHRAGRRVTRPGSHLILISGEAGIGKTRLAEELLEWAGQQGITTARTRSYAAEGSMAYAPVADWLRTETLQNAWKQLDPVWLTEIARLVPELLAENPDLPRPAPLMERWQRNRLFEALVRAVLTTNQPLVLVIDDLQWCDPETLEWLSYLLRFEAQARVLIVGTARVEEIDDNHPLSALMVELRNAGLATRIELGPLNSVDTAALAAQIAGQDLEPEVTTNLFQGTEGNPLFIVETMRMATRQGVSPLQIGSKLLSHSSPSLPPKMQRVIETRLSQLSAPAQDLINVAAVIGRSFTFDLLAAAGSTDDMVLVNALDEAWQRRIIREHGEEAYDFSHDKLRDVAYAGLSTARRRLLHRQVAEAMEKLYAANPGEVSGQLAHHYEQAGLPAQAAGYYMQAVQVEFQLYATTEALEYIDKGLALLETLPDSPERAQLAFGFWATRGAIFGGIKGYAAPECGHAYEQALAQVPEDDGSLQTILVFMGFLVYHLVRADLRKIQTLNQAFLAKAQHSNEPGLLKLAHLQLGIEKLFIGHFIQARQHFEQGEALQVTHTIAFIEDPTLNILSHLAINFWYLGYPDQAQQRSVEVLKLADNFSHPMIKVGLHVYSAWLSYYLGNEKGVETNIQVSLEICVKYGLFYWEALSTIVYGWVMVKQTQALSGIDTIRKSIDDLLSTGARLLLPWYLILLAEAYQEVGQPGAGINTLDEAIDHINSTGERLMEPEVHRLKAELLLEVSPTNQEDAEACFQHALAVSRECQTKSLELRTATSLSRLWQQQGKIAEAHTLLSSVYSWFTEGFDTRDLKAAKALLEQLAPS